MAGSQIHMPTTLYGLDSWFQNIEYSGSSYTTMNTKVAAFETQNGESMLVFYNQACMSEYRNQESLTQYNNAFGFSHSNMCVNFIYDLNGNKGPNTIGKDIGFITVFNAVDSNVVAPMPSSSVNAKGSENINWYQASKACTSEDSESRIPNIDELSAMLINQRFIALSGSSRMWSGSVFNAERAWFIDTGSYGVRITQNKTNISRVRCVKR